MKTRYVSFKKTTQAGFALLMASLVASVVLAIGTVIADLAIKQIVLSGTARESLNALYAADTGTECALFLDFRYNDSTEPSFNPTSQVCNGQTLVFTTPDEPATLSGEVWQQFKLNLIEGDNTGACAYVSVGKSQPAEGQVKTRIRSRGYNICPDGPSGARRVERALQVEY